MKMIALTIAILLAPAALADDVDNNDEPTVGSTVDMGDLLGEDLIQQAIEESAAEGNDCDDEDLLRCMGIDGEQCGTLLASVMRDCTMPLARKILSSDTDMTDDIELEHAKCTFAVGEKDYGIAPQRYLNCMPNGSFQNRPVIQDWLDQQDR